MRLKFFIKYTDNYEKAGKLTVKDTTGTTILDDVPVAVPDSWRAENEISKRISVVSKNYASTPKDVISSSKELKEKYIEKHESLTENNLSMFLLKSEANVSGSSAVLAGSIGAKIKKDKEALVLKEKDFNKIYDKFSDSYSIVVELEASKKMFLWFPEDLSDINTNLKKQIDSLNSIQNQITEEKATVDAYNAANESKQKQLLSDISDSFLKSTTKTQKTTPSQTNPNKTTSSSANKSQPKQKSQKYPSSSSYSSTNYRSPNYNNNLQQNQNNDDIGVLEALFMYNYPGMAPFMRPNSTLAWALYFRHEADEAEQLRIIRSIPGYENISSIHIQRSGDDYQVNFYTDPNCQNYSGCVNYNSDNNQYQFNDCNNNTNSMSYDSNGQNVSCSLTSDKNEEPSVFNFTQSDSGDYSGNYSITSSGKTFESSISIDSSNNLIETTDTSQLTKDFGASFSDLQNNYKEEWTPPPPPPPPPEYNSDNSYNNSSSFKM